jgi:hypothetical protein
VLRTANSDYAAFLYAITDSAFLESGELVKKHPQISKLHDRERALIQQQIYGMICDKTPTGGTLVIGMPPKCPSCGSRKMESWEQISPTEAWPLPVVEHKSWDSKSAVEKFNIIERLIQEVLAKK